DFSVDAMRTEGTGDFSLSFRFQEIGEHCDFTIGALKGTTHIAKMQYAGKFMQLATVKPMAPIEDKRWYKAKVSVRGEKAVCYLDGVELFECKVPQIADGSVGLGTSFAIWRFKNIQVTAPDGTVLLEGLPDLMPPPKLP